MVRRWRVVHGVVFVVVATALGVVGSTVPVLAQTSGIVEDDLKGAGALQDSPVKVSGTAQTWRGGCGDRTTVGYKMNPNFGGNGWGWCGVKPSDVMLPGPDGFVEVRVTTATPSVTQRNSHGQYFQVLFRGGDYATDPNSFRAEFLCAYPAVGNSPAGGGFVSLLHKNGPITVVVPPQPTDLIPCGGTYTVSVKFNGDHYRVFIGDFLALEYTHPPGWPALENKRVGFALVDVSPNHAATGMVWSDFKASSDPAQVPINAPYYACGRTIRDVGGGQYFVDLEAANLTDEAVDSSTSVDRNHKWVTSWGVTRDTPTAATSESNLSVALPPVSQMPEGGWTATFYVWRDRLSPAMRFDDSQFGGGDFQPYDADGEGPGPTLPWWMPTEVHDVYDRLPDNWKRVLVGGSYTDGDHWLAEMGVGVIDEGVQVNGGDFPGFNGGDFDSVVGSCTVTINPVRPSDGNAGGTTGPAPVNICPAQTGTTSTTIAACSTVKPIPPKSDDSTQGEDGSKQDCSAGFLGRLPVIGGAFDATARLVCALKQILVELFIPDDVGAMFDLGEFGTRFPASWVSEGTESVTSLQASISTAAGGSACGPVMNLPSPMSMTIRFPGPAGCGPTAAGASASNDSASFELFGYRSGIRAVIKLFLYLGVVWRLIRLTPWAGDKDDGAPTFDH